MSRKSKKMVRIKMEMIRTKGWYYRINSMKTPLRCDCCGKDSVIRALLSSRDVWLPAEEDTVFACGRCFAAWCDLNKELLVARELMA